VGCFTHDNCLDLLGISPVLYHRATNLQPNLGNDTQDIPLCRVTGWSQHEVRGSQGIEVGNMGVVHMGTVEQLPQLFSGGRRVDMIDSVCGLTRGHMMCPWSDTADTWYDAGQFLYRSPLTEFLETTQLGYLQIGILNIAFIVKKNVYLAVSLEPGNGVNSNRFHFSLLSDGWSLFLFNIESASPNR
jgi:hypothetical protein